MAVKLYNDTDVQNIADSIRAKNGSEDTYKVSEMSAAIDDLEVLDGETVSITPSTSAQTITPSSGHNGITEASVSAVTSAIDANIQAGNIKKDVSILGVTGTLEETPSFPEHVDFATDSWETIKKICDSGQAAKYYKLGEVKGINLSAFTDTGEWYNKNINPSGARLTIVGFHNYETPDGKINNITIMITPGSHASMSSDEYLNFYIANPQQYYGIAGASRLYSWVNNILWGSLPQELKNMCMTVRQRCWNPYNSRIIDNNWRCFIPTPLAIGYDNTVRDTYTHLSLIAAEGYDKTLPYFGNQYDRVNGCLDWSWTDAEKNNNRMFLAANYDNSGTLPGYDLRQKSITSMTAIGTTPYYGLLAPIICI